MKKKLSAKKYMAELRKKLSEENTVDMYRRWLREGYQEGLTAEGEWVKVKLTPDDERRVNDLINFFESKPISRQERIRRAEITRQKLLQKATSVEAMAWLQELPEEALVISGGSGESGGLFQDEALALVRSLYKLGAVKVTAIDIATDRSLPEHQDTDTLIIELPEDTKIRKQLFKKANQLARKYHWDPQEDEGQKYLGIRWD